jgi:putative restriction endonuclease
MRSDHFYAYLDDYIEFDRPVPFREGNRTYESLLAKTDGSTNKGAFGRSVRSIPSDEFEEILRAGFARELDPWEQESGVVAEPPPEFPPRAISTQLVTRPFREVAFRRHVREAYGNRCAVSGLRIINGGGRPEVQAAHIRPVQDSGPDTVRNGLALTGTLHWLFDRGLLSVSDDYRVLVAEDRVEVDVLRLIRPDRRLMVPTAPEHRPHPAYLGWHRENVFKG